MSIVLNLLTIIIFMYEVMIFLVWLNRW